MESLADSHGKMLVPVQKQLGRSHLQMLDFKNLKVGDLVRGRSSKQVYVVTGNYGNRVTAVETVDLTNPIEWEKIDA